MITVFYIIFFYKKPILGAGHHVYADKPQLFNKYVNDTCALADTDQPLPILHSNGTSTPKKENKQEEDEDMPVNKKPLPLTEDVH